MSADLLAHAEAAQKTADHLRRGTSGRADKEALDARAEADTHERKARLLHTAHDLGVEVTDPNDERSVAFACLARFGLHPDSDCSEHRSDPLRTQNTAYVSARVFVEIAKAKKEHE